IPDHQARRQQRQDRPRVGALHQGPAQAGSELRLFRSGTRRPSHVGIFLESTAVHDTAQSGAQALIIAKALMVVRTEGLVGAAAPARLRGYTASCNFTASSRLTETSCDTPRSAMVTPNRRFMRAMVIGLCVTVTKRVSVAAVISCSRSQKRSTL